MPVQFRVEGIGSLGDGVTGSCELPDGGPGDLGLAPGVERQNQPLVAGVCIGDSQGLHLSGASSYLRSLPKLSSGGARL